MSALTENVIIATGGSSGNGQAAALSSAKQGAEVIITARGATALEKAAADHPNIVGLVVDAGSPEDTERTIAKAVDGWGAWMCVLVSNAGERAMLPLAEATADRIFKIFAVNVGSSRIAVPALPYFVRAKGRTATSRAALWPRSSQTRSARAGGPKINQGGNDVCPAGSASRA